MHLSFKTAALASLLLACTPDPSDASDASTTEATSTGPLDPPTTAGTDTTEDPATSTTTEATPTETTTGAIGCADLPLCDDFEAAAADGPPDPALWTVASPNCAGTGSVSVSADQAHGGAHSLRVDGGGGYCDHVFIAHGAALAGIGPQLFGRFFVRLDAALGPGHVTFLTLRDAADGPKDLRMGGQSEILMWNRESDDATLPSLSPAGIALSLAPVPQQWTCIEFMVDQELGQLITWVDGAEVPGLRVDAEATPDVDQQWLNKPNWRPVLEDIKFGWESYAGQTMVLHFDDIALAATRIGCD